MAPDNSTGDTAVDTACHRERLKTLDRFDAAWNAHGVDCCDLFIFDGPLIAVKDSYRKSRV